MLIQRCGLVRMKGRVCLRTKTKVGLFPISHLELAIVLAIFTTPAPPRQNAVSHVQPFLSLFSTLWSLAGQFLVTFDNTLERPTRLSPSLALSTAASPLICSLSSQSNRRCAAT